LTLFGRSVLALLTTDRLLAQVLYGSI